MPKGCAANVFSAVSSPPACRASWRSPAAAAVLFILRVSARFRGTADWLGHPAQPS